MLIQQRQHEIRQTVKDLQNSFWSRRTEIFSLAPEAPEFLFPLHVGILIRKHLGLTLLEPEFIPPEPGEESRFSTAGYIHRPSLTVAIAQRFSTEQRRFTAAHEVGHWFLHTGMMYHHTRILRRDRPLSGPNRSMPRSIEEQEADFFAAELLMPTKILRREMEVRFGGSIEKSTQHESLQYWLLRAKTPFEVAKMDRTDVAFAIAEAAHYAGRTFTPLTARFGVSPMAMAIQLTDLSLVR